MTDQALEFSPAVAELLDRFTPVPQVEPAWEALSRQLPREAQRGSRRRLIVVAAALAAATLALVVVTPLGGAVRRTLGDFSAWLQGTPGEPVSEEEQRAFDEANERSWGGFPGSPQLRQLAKIERDGVSYRLVGFRSEGALCLRVSARGEATGSTLVCAPVSELRNDESPARVLVADWSVGRGEKKRQIGFDILTSAYGQVTAGIAADGVDAVELVDDHGTHRVETQANAFIYVAERPEVGQRVTHVRAVLSDGSMLGVPLATSPVGPMGGFGSNTSGEPGGPTSVERHVRGGRIGWFELREERGEPVGDLLDKLAPFGRPEFARLLTPDPSSSKRIALAELPGGLPGQPSRGPSLCAYLITRGGTSGGCSPVGNAFPRDPFSFGWSAMGGGDQFATFSGIASDDVARLEAFTATGNTISVPLADNTYLVEISLARLPVKLVAYDQEGRVIGIEQTPREEVTGRVIEPPIFEKTLDVPNVGTLKLRGYRTEDGGRCYYMRGTGGLRVSGGGCAPKEWNDGPVRVGPYGDPIAAAVGLARGDVARVVFRYADGREASFTPDENGFVLEALAPELRAPQKQLVEIRGERANGTVVVRERLGHRAPP
jgi:hypothetical protein